MDGIEAKRVDWGTVKSKSGLIDVSLSSSEKDTMLTEPRPFERAGSIDCSISDVNEIEEKTNPVKRGGLSNGLDISETGHDTDRTQAMQISSRTLDDFVIDDTRESSLEETSEGGSEVPTKDGTGDVKKPVRRPKKRSKVAKMLHPIRMACGRVVNYPKFQYFVVILIVVNAIMMGIGTFDFVTESPSVSSSFETVDQVFLILFTVELVMQLLYRGFKLFLDGWLVFDFVIVVISWSLSSLQIIRAFRVFRALRLVTRVETLRKLVTALLDVMPNMTAIFFLLLLLFYIFAVMFTVLFKDLYEQGLTEVDYFSSLTITLFTLFQMMTLDFGVVARQAMAVYPWAWAPFLAFVAISGFIVFNLIIAVVCDSVASVENEEKEEKAAALNDDESVSSVDSKERVRELRCRMELLMQNQLEMQSAIENIVKGLQVEGRC